MKKPTIFRDILKVLAVSAKLGLTSFGGPIAHLGYFHNEYIHRRKWMDERSYADLVAICQFLPGPTSSQVGIGIGIVRAGWFGGLAAWLGFTMPSLIVMILFAFLLQGFDISSTGFIHGLKIVAVAIVAQAVLSMGQKLAPDRNRATIVILAASVTLIWQTAYSQVLVLALAGIAGMILYRKIEMPDTPKLNVSISRGFAAACLILFFGLMLALPMIRSIVGMGWVSLFDSFYRAGSFVFGGGHVVLPLLEREVVPTEWISKSDFLAGYGAAQAVPGPLFTFAGYVGAMISGVPGALIAAIAVFLPGFLLMVGVLPFWNDLRHHVQVQSFLIGVNAAVVGILLSALYNPLWATAIIRPADFALASILFLMLVYWKLPPWAAVIAGAAGGMVIGYCGL